MSKGQHEKANMGGEEYLKGRRAGVERTYGESRMGVAERTVIRHGHNEGGGEGELPAAASSIYSRAVGSAEDPSRMGDQALRDR